MSEDAEYRIGISELAELLGTSKSSLRYYEREGLIMPGRTASGGYRTYTVDEMIELTDVMIYRELGVPVKEIRRLMDSPIEQTDFALEAAEDSLLDQLAQVEHGLRTIAGRRNRIRRYHQALASGPHLVDAPAVEKLYPFDLSDPTMLGRYIKDPLHAGYTALFEDAEQSSSYADCSVNPLGGSAETVWTAPRRHGLWLECLLETGYNDTGDNDLPAHVEELRELGHEPGCALAQYLTFSTDERGRHDYYLCWIQAL